MFPIVFVILSSMRWTLFSSVTKSVLNKTPPRKIETEPERILVFGSLQIYLILSSCFLSCSEIPTNLRGSVYSTIYTFQLLVSGDFRS